MQQCQIYVREDEKDLFLKWCESKEIPTYDGSDGRFFSQPGDKYIFIISGPTRWRSDKSFTESFSRDRRHDYPLIEISFDEMKAFSYDDEKYINQTEIQQFKKQLNNQL